MSPNPREPYHWSWNAESQFLIGDAMGKAALRLAYSRHTRNGARTKSRYPGGGSV